jgi:hypothetical protein
LNQTLKEHSSARKRRLMLLQDAAISSRNFNKNGTAEFGSVLKFSEDSLEFTKIKRYSFDSIKSK